MENKQIKLEPFIYKYDPEHLYFMKRQIWESINNVSVYSKLSQLEHEQYKAHINKPKRVLDLGCGLGRAAIYLNHMLNDPEVHFILADANEDSQIVTGKYASNNQEKYNKLDLTASFCKLNGLTNFETFDIYRNDWNQLKDIDLVISHCSVGMHYPVKDALPNLLKVTTPNCVMVFGTRNRMVYSKNSFKNLFETVIFLPQNYIQSFPQQDWLILKNKKN